MATQTRKIMRKNKKKVKSSKKLNIKEFLDVISPSTIDFSHPDYYVINNTYRCVWAIRRYETETEEQALFRELGEKDGVTLHIYTNLLSKSETDELMKKAERKNKYNRNSSKNIQETTEAEENLSNIQVLARRMHKTKEPLINCAVFIEMLATSKEQLNIIRGDVMASLNRYKMVYDNLWLLQKKGFISVNPFGYNAFGKEFERALPASSIANLYPFSYSGKTDPNGFYIGKDINGSNIIVNFDRRSSDKTNGHILILGNSGEGKSWLCRLIQCNLRQAGKKLYILDPENEYEDVTKNLGGTYLNMMSGEHIINVLEPKLWSDKSEDNLEDKEAPAAFLKGSRLSQHIAFLRDFFKCYKDFTVVELDTLEIMLEKLYKKFNITDNTDFEKLSSEDYPILSDLHQLLTDELDTDFADKIYTKDTIRTLCLKLNSICVGSESIFFNGYTNIPNADHIDFNVKDMLSTNENLKNAMFFNIMSYMSHKFLTEGNATVVFDEFHEFLKNPIALSYARSFIKRGRKKDSDVIVASQNPEDFFLPEIIAYTKPILSTPTHKFLFYPGTLDEKEYQRVMGVKQSEYNIIRYPNQGHCLYMCGIERYHLQVIAPPHKAALFGNAGGR